MAKKLFATWLKTADFSQFQNQVTLLWELGHLPNYETYEDARAAIVNREHPDFLAGTASYQAYSLADDMPLACDANFGAATARSVAQRFCACPDIRRAGAVSKWSFTDLNCWWRGPNDLGLSDVKDRWLAAANTWGKYTPLTVRWWAGTDGGNGPNVYCDTFRIDGRNNVLAYQYLPSANAPRTEKNQQVIDTAEDWVSQSWFLHVVASHEWGHAFGLDHIPVSGPRGGKALMNPSAQRLEGDYPQQPLDIAAIQALYGKKDPTDPEPPPPKPGSMTYSVRQTTTDGRTVIVTTEIVE